VFGQNLRQQVRSLRSLHSLSGCTLQFDHAFTSLNASEVSGRFEVVVCPAMLHCELISCVLTVTLDSAKFALSEPPSHSSCTLQLDPALTALDVRRGDRELLLE